MAVDIAFLILIIVEMVQSHTPYCTLETKDDISSCSVTQIDDDEPNFFPIPEFNLTRKYLNVTHGYVNATFSFSNYEETVWKLLAYAGEKIESIWVIQAVDCSKQVPKGTVHLHFLPVSYNFSHVVLKILKQETDVLCKDSMYSEVCSNLSYAFLALQSHAMNNALLLTMNMTHQVNLTIELMQGMCIVDCSGKPNLCDVLIEKFHWVMDGSSVYTFENRQPAFYCARVYPEHNCMGDDCCTFGTNATYLLSKDEALSGSTELVPDFKRPPIDLILMILCFTMVIVFVASLFRIKSLPQISADNDCLTTESASFITRNLTSYTTLEIPRYSQLSPVLISTTEGTTLSKVEVFLLYSRQSDTFLSQMNEFRERLEEDQIKVYDMNCANFEEEINRESVAWIEKIINNGNMKYILVEHMEAVERYKKWIEDTQSNTEFRPPHHLDQLFLYALSSIHNKFVEDKCIVHDYRRLFVVNFQHENELSCKYTNLVPFKRYCLNNDRDDDHYRQLIRDLSLGISSSESIL